MSTVLNRYKNVKTCSDIELLERFYPNHADVIYKQAGNLVGVINDVSIDHPGIDEPSSSDINLTKILKESLRLIDVDVLDHIVVGGNECCSMSYRGMI